MTLLRALQFRYCGGDHKWSGGSLTRAPESPTFCRNPAYAESVKELYSNAAP